MGSVSYRQSRTKRTRTYAESAVFYDRERRQRCYQQPAAALLRRRRRRQYAAELTPADWGAQQQAGVDVVASHQPLSEWLRFWH
jgi:hypothetical protein